MNVAVTHTAILRTLNTHGLSRDIASFDKQMSLVDLVRLTNGDIEQVRQVADALCVPTQFSDAPLIKIADDVYAQRIMMVGFDHCKVRENDEQTFDVRNSGRVWSTHATKSAAANAAEVFDHERSMSQCVLCRPVVADFHDCGRNASGEQVCYPDR
jgi:hypothetical protein